MDMKNRNWTLIAGLLSFQGLVPALAQTPATRLSTAPLTIAARFTIRGASGSIDDSQYPLINNGTIQADVAGGIITIQGNPFTNNGTTQELNGGKIVIVP